MGIDERVAAYDAVIERLATYTEQRTNCYRTWREFEGDLRCALAALRDCRGRTASSYCQSDEWLPQAVPAEDVDRAWQGEGRGDG